TKDLCSGGIASNPPEASGTACNQSSGTMCNSSGSAPACVQCLQPSDCPGTDTECHHRTCSATGMCGISNTPDGTLVQSQMTGDCKEKVCNGNGSVVDAADDNALPVDGNGCTADLCSNGVATNPSAPAGDPCNQGSGSMCNGSATAPACVQCLSKTDCGTDTT